MGRHWLVTEQTTPLYNIVLKMTLSEIIASEAETDLEIPSEVEAPLPSAAKKKKKAKNPPRNLKKLKNPKKLKRPRNLKSQKNPRNLANPESGSRNPRPLSEPSDELDVPKQKKLVVVSHFLNSPSKV